MTREETIHRAQEAARLLSEPLLQEALELIERDAIERVVAATHDQDDVRRYEALRVAVAREVRDQLRSVITTGQQAAR